MSQVNAGWLFYKKNFFHLSSNDPKFSLEQSNVELLNIQPVPVETKPKSTNSFSVTTIYPGLIIGVGYSHGIKGEADNFDLGFYFDHTTGMPMIPGSSLKGTLRSIFKRLKNERERESIIAFFKDIFSFCGSSLLSTLSDDESYEILKKIENNIFEGKDANNKQIGLYARDKFFDAGILSGDDKNLIFTDDNLAPHHKNLFKEPNVIKFLKVRPNVTFEFSFELHDMCIDDNIVLTAKQKEKLFNELIYFTGIGAKTNVGYGQFEVIEKETTSVVEEEEVSVVEFNFDSFVNDLDNATNAKNIKNLIKNMKKEHTLDEEEKEKLTAIVNKHITSNYTLPDDWDDLSAKKKRAIIDGEYVDALTNINK